MRLTSIAVLSALLAACGTDEKDPDTKQSSIDYDKLEVAAISDTGLKLVNDDELGQHIKNGIRLNLKNGSNTYLRGGDLALEGGAPPEPSDAPNGQQKGEDGGGASGDSDSEGFSGTNVHVDGVDEADVAKYDGKHWFVATSRVADDFLVDNHTPGFHIVATDPATPDAEILARVSLDDEKQSWGSVNEMYLVQANEETSHVATVRSQWGNVYPVMPGIMVRGGIAVDLPAFNDVAIEPAAMPETEVQTSLRIAEDGDTAVGLPYTDPVNSQVRLQLTDVETANAPEIDWELKIDGSLINSRKVDNMLYLVTRFDPWVDGLFYEYGDDGTRTKNETELAQVAPEKLLPHYYLGDSSLPLSEGCYIQKTATDHHGFASLVSITAINLETQKLVSSQCINGAVEAMSMSTDSLYLTGTVYEDRSRNGRTVIHKFDLSDEGPAYVATGSAAGSLGWNSDIAFRMHEKDDTFRIVTSFWEAEGPVHQLTILKEQGDQLTKLSTLPNSQRPEPIGKPREDIYSVRFEGDKAYIVTFERTDPLYAIDLSDPADPFIAGELEIPGFATYMHPVAENYLFTLGRDADENGRVKGMKAELVYTGNGDPEVVNTLYFDGNGTQSEALHNLKAMSFKRDTDRMRISFPLTKYSASYDWEYSGLQLLEITGLADNSSTDLIAATSPRLVNAGQIISQRPDDTRHPKDYGINRSIIHDDAVFYASNNSYWAAKWNDPQSAVGPIREEPVACIAIAPPPALKVNISVEEGTDGNACDATVRVINHTTGTEETLTPTQDDGDCVVEAYGAAGEYTVTAELEGYRGQKSWAVAYRNQCHVITSEIDMTLSQYQCEPGWKPELVAYVDMEVIEGEAQACDAEVTATVNGERVTLTAEKPWENESIESGSGGGTTGSSSSGSSDGDSAGSEDIIANPAPPIDEERAWRCRFSAEYEATDAEVTFAAKMPGFTSPHTDTVVVSNQQCYNRVSYGKLILLPSE